MNSNPPNFVHVKGRDAPDTWKQLVKQINLQPERLAGEDYQGNNSLTKHAPLVYEFDEEAIEQIISGIVHPAFRTGPEARNIYCRELTYAYMFMQWNTVEIKKFIYNYFDRLANHPTPSLEYQGDVVKIPDDAWQYFNCVKDGGFKGSGFDQIAWLHNAIRKDGISRRHQITTWIPGRDNFSTSPPCLQIINCQVLVPKSEWHKYPGCIPIDCHISYRSWDIFGAGPSNWQAILQMLYRYIFGNLDRDTEYVTIHGDPVKFGEVKEQDDGTWTNQNDVPVILNPDNKIEFKPRRVLCFADNGHGYQNDYDILDRATVKR